MFATSVVFHTSLLLRKIPMYRRKRRATSRKVEEVLAIDGWDREKGEYITHRLDEPEEEQEK